MHCSIIIFLLLKLSLTLSFLRIKRYYNSINRYHATIESRHLFMNNNDIGNTENMKSSDDDLKREALKLLDCLTSPKDQDDPQYDVDKDVRRDELLLSNDYNELKSELRARGLRSSGDKLEMITRLLLHIVDPSIKFDQMSGLEANLKYIDANDLDTKKIRIVPESERLVSLEDNDPDAEDLVALKKKSKIIANSPRNVVGGGKPNKNNRLIMDGLSRKETSIIGLSITSSSVLKDKSHSRSAICSYIVSSKDVLKNWGQNAHVIIFLPSEVGWRSKAMRLLADEIAFTTQSIVIIPDIYKGMYYSKQGEVENSKASLNAIHLLMEESLSRSSDKDSSVSTMNTQYNSTSSSTTSDDMKTPMKEIAFQSKCTNTMEDWLAIQKFRNDSMFNDIISTIHYARTELSARSVSIAGVGYGGGKALESTCYLHDLARYAQYEEILTSYIQSQQLLHVPNNINDDDNDDDDIEEDEDDIICLKIKSILSYNLNGSPSTTTTSSSSKPLQYDMIKAKIIKYHSIFMKPSKRIFELKLGKEIPDDEIDNTEINSFSEIIKQYSTNNKNNETDSSNSNDNIEEERQIEIDKLSVDELEFFEDLNLNDNHNNNHNNNGDDDAAKSVIEEAMYNLYQTEKTATNCNNNNNITVEEELLKEWELIVSCTERVRVKKLLSTTTTTTTTYNTSSRTSTISTYYPSLSSTLSLRPSEFLSLVPKSVLALTPNRFNIELVAKYLHNAAFIVYHTADDSTPCSSANDARYMYNSFNDRINDIIDYCFRIYQIKKSQHSLADDFIYAPRMEYDMKCSQDAVSMGAMWLDAFSTLVIDDMTDGVGETKLDMNGSIAYTLITEDDLKDISLRPSAIGDYLHDDVDLFRNNRLDN